jgi:PhnB protein
MMKTNTYLFFDGNCAEAFKFYEQVLGAKTQMVMHYEGSPAAGQVPADKENQVLHGRITVGDSTLLASDCPPGSYNKPQGYTVTLDFDKPAEAERIFHALAEGGSVTMPMEKTFFAERFGMLVDRFAIPWMVMCEKSA